MDRGFGLQVGFGLRLRLCTRVSVHYGLRKFPRNFRYRLILSLTFLLSLIVKYTKLSLNKVILRILSTQVLSNRLRELQYPVAGTIRQ